MSNRLLSAIQKEIAPLTMSNLQYFLDTTPEEYSIEDYSNSCRGSDVFDETTEKRLQNDWRCKLIPRLKESNEQLLRETGARLEKTWKLDKRRLLERTKDERANKKYKRGMQQAYQEHQLKVVQMSSKRLEKDLTDIRKYFSSSRLRCATPMTKFLLIKNYSNLLLSSSGRVSISRGKL